MLYLYDDSVYPNTYYPCLTKRALNLNKYHILQTSEDEICVCVQLR